MVGLLSLLPSLPHYDGLDPQTVGRNKPFFPCFVRYFDRAVIKITNKGFKMPSPDHMTFILFGESQEHILHAFNFFNGWGKWGCCYWIRQHYLGRLKPHILPCILSFLLVSTYICPELPQTPKFPIFVPSTQSIRASWGSWEWQNLQGWMPFLSSGPG